MLLINEGGKTFGTDVARGSAEETFQASKQFTMGAFHKQGSPGGGKMTILKSHFSHDISTQMAPLGPN